MASVTVIDKKNPVKICGGIRVDKKRVAAYCRVSTDSEDQKKSYDTQVAYYTDLISKNPDWMNVGIYADEAITGTSIEKRVEFQRLISDCTSGNIDVVLTKSISRFARNTLDTLTYVRLLKEHQVEVVFEDENIHTLSMEGEMLLTVLSSVYQQEVENISSNVKKGLKMRAMRGEVTAFRGCLGYDYDPDTKSITVNEPEAKVVRYIYTKYLEGMGANSIAKLLMKKGYKTRKGNSKWTGPTVIDVLKNEKYVGDVLIGKTYTLDPISKKRLHNYGEEEKILISDNHEPIISREVFQQAQEIRMGRNINRYGYKGEIPETRPSRYTAKYAFSGKIVCGMCGSKYVRRTQRGCDADKKVIWACKTQKQVSRNACPDSRALNEKPIEIAFVESCHELFCNRTEMLDEFLVNVRDALSDDGNIDAEDRVQHKLDLLLQKKDRLLDTKLKNLIEDEEFEKKNIKLTAEINAKKMALETMKKERETAGDIKNRIKSFREVLSKGEPIKEFDRKLFETLVDRIVIGGYANGVPQKDRITFVFSPNANFNPVRAIDTGIAIETETIELLNFDIHYPHWEFVRDADSISKEVRQGYTVSVRLPIHRPTKA